jgi:hypothetical protein
MASQVPGWVYRSRSEWRDPHAWRAVDPAKKSEARGREFDAVAGPRRVWMTEAAVSKLLKIEWSELRRLVDAERLPQHKPRSGYGHIYRRSDINKMLSASLRGHRPLGPDPPRKSRCDPRETDRIPGHRR